MLQQSVHPSGRRASTARDSQRCLYGALGTSAVSTLLRCLLGGMIELRVWAGVAQAPCLPHFIPFLSRGFNNFVVSPYFLTRSPFPRVIGNQSAAWGQQEMPLAACLGLADSGLSFWRRTTSEIRQRARFLVVPCKDLWQASRGPSGVTARCHNTTLLLVLASSLSNQLDIALQFCWQNIYYVTVPELVTVSD